MIRPITTLCIAASCGSGLYLYSEKHRTALLDRQIAVIMHQTEAARQRTGLLRAEWALLNEPGRLQDMANKYLSLKPMAPGQFVSLADLSGRLPAPLMENAVASDDQTDGDDAAPAVLAAAAGSGKAGDAAASADNAPHAADAGKPSDGKTQTARQAGSKSAGGKTHAPAALDTDAQGGAGLGKDGMDTAGADTQGSANARTADGRSPDPHAGVKQVAHEDGRARQAHHVATAAYAAPDGMFSRGAPLPLATPQPRVRIFSALAHPLAATARPAMAAAAPRYASPSISSALAGGGALPPPTPYTGDR